MKAMRLIVIAFCLLTLGAICVAGFEDEFRDPPEWTRPWCYWFFLNGDITEDGITKDLEAMSRVGIGQVQVGSDIAMASGGYGPVLPLSDQWWQSPAWTKCAENKRLA